MEILQFNLDHCQSEISLYCGQHSVILLSHWSTSPHPHSHWPHVLHSSCPSKWQESVRPQLNCCIFTTVFLFSENDNWRASIQIVSRAERWSSLALVNWEMTGCYSSSVSRLGMDLRGEQVRYYYLQHFSITDMFYFSHKYLSVGPRCLDKQDRTQATWPHQVLVNCGTLMGVLSTELKSSDLTSIWLQQCLLEVWR